MSNVLARSLLLIAVALAAAIGCWFVFQREAPPTIAVDRSTAAPQLAETRPAQQSAPVDPALASPSTPHVADVADTNGDASRSAVGGSLEGRTWSDLIVAVDRTSGAPIDGAHLALIDADGELRRPRLDENVLATDLSSGVLLALDSPSHVPRFFFAEHLANHAGAPRTVALHPSGALSFAAVGDDVLPAFDLRLHHTQDDDSPKDLDAHLVAAGFDTLEAREPFHALGKSLRHLLDESNDARGRKRQVRWLTRTETLHVALTPDGPPTTSGWSNVALDEVANLPLSIDDLVGGVDVLIEVTPAGVVTTNHVVSEFAYRVRGDTEWRTATMFSGRVPIAAGVVTELELRRPGMATVRGVLPNTASDARAFVVHAVESGVSMPTREELLPTDQAFVLSDVAPGRNLITLHWRAADGAFATRVFDVTLTPDEERDLGAIDVAEDSCELVIASGLFVDGEMDITGLGGRLPTFEFDVYVRAAGALELHDVAVVRAVPLRLSGPGEVVVRGLPAGDQFVSATALVVPAECARAYQQDEYPRGREVKLGAGRARVEIQFRFASALEHAFRLNVPAPVVGSQLELEAWAFDSGTDREVQIDLLNERLSDLEPRARVVEGSASLPSGEWVVVAVARPSWRSTGRATLEPRDGLVLQSFVGSASFTANTAGALVVVDLALAAVADGGATLENEPRPVSSDGSVSISYHTARPPQLPRAASRMWHVQLSPSGRLFAVWCLFPNTDYVDHSGSPFFRSGGPGSVTELGPP